MFWNAFLRFASSILSMIWAWSFKNDILFLGTYELNYARLLY